MNKKVCISGYYGFDNFGDETILKILTDNLKLMKSVGKITVFSASPLKTSEYLKVESVNSFKFTDVIKELIQTDSLISGGGSLLQDVTSIKSLIYYLGVILTAKILGKKIIIFSQGIGPINNNILKKLTFFLLKHSNFVTVRDNESYNLLKSNGINAIKTADPVWNIPKQETVKKQNSLGIQIRNFKNITDDFILNLAQAINYNYPNKEIYIFSLQNKLDMEVCNKLKNQIIKFNSNAQINILENNSNEEIIKDLSQMEEIIAMRYHACLIAIKNNIKLLPINYDNKVKNLAENFQLECIEMNNLKDTNETIKRFKEKKIEYNQEYINSLFYDFNKLEEKL